MVLCNDRISGVLAAARLCSGSTAITVRGMLRNIKSCTRAWQISVRLLGRLTCPRGHFCVRRPPDFIPERLRRSWRYSNFPSKQFDLHCYLIFGLYSGRHGRFTKACEAKFLDKGLRIYLRPSRPGCIESRPQHLDARSIAIKLPHRSLCWANMKAVTPTFQDPLGVLPDVTLTAKRRLLFSRAARRWKSASCARHCGTQIDAKSSRACCKGQGRCRVHY
jgi:hypothetical protein